MPSRHRVPVWLMGLTNLTYGLYGGVVAFAVPQLLGNRGVPEAAIAGLTENLVQSLAITVSMGIIFDTIGRHNPLAATTFCFISSAYGVPISYMLYVDSFGFSHGGIAGSLITDALTGILASLLLGLMLLWLGRRSPTEKSAAPV